MENELCPEHLASLGLDNNAVADAPDSNDDDDINEYPDSQLSEDFILYSDSDNDTDMNHESNDFMDNRNDVSKSSETSDVSPSGSESKILRDSRENIPGKYISKSKNRVIFLL